jgi:hypothetical protein
MKNKSLTFSILQALSKLRDWNRESKFVQNDEIFKQIRELGLPKRILAQLCKLVKLTRKFAGETFFIGKMILIRILHFIKVHPFLVTSIGLSVVIANIVASLIASIPVFGGYLISLLSALKIDILLKVGSAIYGVILDERFPSLGKSVFEIAEDFFCLFIDVFNIIFAGNNHAQSPA